MIARSGCRARFSACTSSLVLAALLLGGGAAAQRLEKPVQDWFKQYRLLVLPDEVKVLQHLKPADLEEFARIFWARRSTSPAGAANAYRASVEKASAEADVRFGDVGKKGSETGCGQALLLLGIPDEVSGRELRTTFNSRPSMEGANSRIGARDGARRAELWIYKSNTTRTFRMPAGELKLQFDDGCEFDEGARTLDELARLAAARVLHPEIRYEFGADGHLRPLGAAPRAVSPARALLEQPRADFTLAFEPKIQVPGQGGAYTAGIVRGGPGSLRAPADGSPVRLRVVARAAPGSGPAVFGEERDAAALVQADGSFVTSYGLTLPAGRCSVAVSVLDPESGRSAVATADVEAPDYAGKALVVSPLVVLSGDTGDAGRAPGSDPYAAFAIGAERFQPRAGNVLGQSDSLRLLVLVHNATLEPGTARASLKASFSVLQDGKVVAKGKDQVFDTAGSAPSVGPIRLAAFAPGRYLAQVEVTDAVSKTTVVRETPFEVIVSMPVR